MKLPIGTKVTIFGRYGFNELISESVKGKIIKYEDDSYIIKTTFRNYKIPITKTKIEINLTTIGESLEQYETGR